jgi:integrase
VVILKFLEWLVSEKKRPYNTVRGILSTVLQTLERTERILGKLRWIKVFMEGVRKGQPIPDPLPPVWDVATLIEALRKWPEKEEKHIAMTTRMTYVLLTLATMWRPKDDMMKIRWGDVMIVGEGKNRVMTVRAVDTKTKREQRAIPIKAMEEETTCPVAWMVKYKLEMQEEVKRAEGPEITAKDQLFRITRRPFGPATGDTLRRWMREAMEMAKIDTTVYKPHSARSATTTAARLGGMPMDTIMAYANWQSKTTFERYYFRPPDRTVSVVDDWFETSNITL